MFRFVQVILFVGAICVGCSSEAPIQPQDKTVSNSSITPHSLESSNKQHMNESEYEVEEVYTDLREQVLKLKHDFLAQDGEDPSRLVAVLMETGYPEAVATLVAVSEGSASIYFSNGGGLIGAGGHESVNAVSREFIEEARSYVSKATLTDQYPLPQKGSVRFYLITQSGVYTIEAKEDDLGYERHAIAPLFHKAHELIAAIRKTSPE